jgi:hypothetical protein
MIMPATAVTTGITHSCHLIEIGGRTFFTDLGTPTLNSLG